MSEHHKDMRGNGKERRTMVVWVGEAMKKLVVRGPGALRGDHCIRRQEERHCGKIMNGALVAAVLVLGLAASSVEAAEINAVGVAGVPLSDVAVWLMPESGARGPRGAGKIVEIGQKNRKFEERVSVVEMGKKVAFPNHDVVYHQVYSFSKPKIFDLKLYAGGESPQIDFEKQGLVILGCNLHDKMLAYLKVVPSGVYAVTDAKGTARLDIPNSGGPWVIMAWHPSMGEEKEGVVFKVSGDGVVRIDLGQSEK